MSAARLGTIRVLSASVLCYSLGFLLLGLSNGLIAVFISFVLGSIAFGIFHPVAFSAVAKSATESDLGSSMGLFAATGDIGKIAFAAILSFLVSLTSWRFTSTLYGIIASVLFMICFLLALRKGKERETGSAGKMRRMDFHILKTNGSHWLMQPASSILSQTHRCSYSFHFS